MEKPQIAFFIKNSNISSVDCSNLSLGNPGIGGSEYAILCVVEGLYKSGKINAVLLVESTNCKLPSIPIIEVADIKDAILKCELNGIGVIVLPYSSAVPYNEFICTKGSPVKFIIWCHNFVAFQHLELYAKSPSVLRLITVGKEQMDLYLDHRAYNKSDYIYNPIPDQLIEYVRNRQLLPWNQRPHEVTYIGSIVPGKSFHVLAEAWPKILKSHPDAILNVIGSGQVYDRNLKMGPLGIAEESYEATFSKFIAPEGKILPSVRFHGILGTEKNDILARTRIGVPNPTGNTETFGFTAVEMQLFGALIVTARCAGYLDTVDTTRSILYTSTDFLADSINSLLDNNTNIDNNSVLQEINEKFSLSSVVSDWEKLIIQCLPSGTHLHPIILTNSDYDYKRFKFWLRKIKMRVPGGYYIIPSFHIFKKLSKFILLK